MKRRMDLNAIIEALQLKQIGKVKTVKKVSGGYSSDLLSDVMAHAKPGNLLVTVLVHENVVAVASLLELSAILITGGKKPAAETVRRAEEQGVPLLVTDMNTFEAVGKLYTLLQGVDKWAV
jgi:predicted transcriptional regulator